MSVHKITLRQFMWCFFFVSVGDFIGEAVWDGFKDIYEFFGRVIVRVALALVFALCFVVYKRFRVEIDFDPDTSTPEITRESKT